MVTVKNLVKSFGNVRALDDLSFSINRGEIVGLLGPNGAGKTTTMRLLTGFFSPDSGKIEIGGALLNDLHLTEVQQRIGYLPENNPLYKGMLVSEFLNLAADLKGIPKSKRPKEFDFVVSSVSLSDVYYCPIGELSKGYKQRVGLAAALLNSPEVLIMDEPTEGLDPNQRTEIRSLIKGVAHNRTVIVSTHVIQEAVALCSRMLIINKGKLVADGTTEELSQAAKHERILILHLEGNGIELALRNLPGVEHVDISQRADGKVHAKLTAHGAIELRPEISRLAHTHNWTIWKLAEEEHKMEDIFHKLTSEG
jgi:ABC-2 type transport system ATP-binding protein